MHSDERGSALVIVLLMLMLMSALAAALGTSGRTETLISRNHRSQVQAQLAAEAGLNHATAVAVDYIFNWKTHNCGAGVPNLSVDAGVAAAVYTLIVGPTLGNCALDGSDGTVSDFLTVKGIPPATDGTEFARDASDLSVSGADDCTESTTTCYEVRILDDPNDGCNPAAATNCKLLIKSTGYAADDTTVKLEAIITPVTLPAVAANGNFTIAGHASVTGSGGGVHANGNITVTGTSATVAGDVTASGTYTAPTGSTIHGEGGTSPVHIPTISASDYLVWADYILTSAGTMTNASGAVVCTWTSKTPCNNWDWNSGTSTWILNSNTVVAGTYYVQGKATVSGSPGSTKNPASLSIIATGSIEISGSPKLAPDSPELLFVTDQDLKINGTIDEIGDDAKIQGQLLVHGQVEIAGNASLDGQLVVEDANVGSLVTSNSMSGNSNLNYGGSLGTGTYSVAGWREVR
jgi:hypothetical protein